MSRIPDAIEYLMLATALGLIVVGGIITFKVAYGLVRGEIDALELITTKGKLAEEKISTIVGKLACLFTMLKDASDGSPTLELQLAMAALIFAHELLKRWQSIGLEKAKIPEPAPAPAGTTTTTTTKTEGS